MADLSKVNIRAVLDHLRPGAAYQWRGNAKENPDYGHQYDAIGEWRDKSTKKPSEEEILDAWPTVQTAMQTAETEATRREKVQAAIPVADLMEAIAEMGEVLEAVMGVQLATLKKEHRDKWRRVQKRLAKVREAMR